MRIRDEKLKRETKQLERTYKICKQEIEKINQAMSGNPDAVELADLNYQRGFLEGRLQSAGAMLNFFQDYNAQPLELAYELSREAKMDQVQADRILQLLNHHLSAYTFELAQEQKGAAVHGENIRSAVQVINVLVSVLEILNPGYVYKFFDGRSGSWAGIYCFEKGREHEDFQIVLKQDIPR